MPRIEFVQDGSTSAIIKIDGKKVDHVSHVTLNAHAGDLPEVSLRCLLVHEGDPQTVLDIEAKVRYVVEFIALNYRAQSHHDYVPNREFEVEEVGLNEWHVRARGPAAAPPEQPVPA